MKLGAGTIGIDAAMATATAARDGGIELPKALMVKLHKLVGSEYTRCHRFEPLADLFGPSSQLTAICSIAEVRQINQKVVESALQRMWLEPTIRKPEQIIASFSHTCALISVCFRESVLAESFLADLTVLQTAMDSTNGDVAPDEQKKALAVIHDRSQTATAVCILKTLGRAAHFKDALAMIEKVISEKFDAQQGHGAMATATNLLGKFAKLDEQAMSAEDIDLLRSTVSVLITTVKDEKEDSRLLRDFNSFIKKMSNALSTVLDNIVMNFIDLCESFAREAQSGISKSEATIDTLLKHCKSMSIFNMHNIWVEFVPAGIDAEGIAKTFDCSEGRILFAFC